MDRLIARGYGSAVNVRGRSFPQALMPKLKAPSHLHFSVLKARPSRFLVKAADFQGIADDDPSWVQWWIVDLSGKESPRKNLFTPQHVQETEELQERMIHTSFSKEELRVLVRHRIIMVHAQFSPANREFSTGWDASEITAKLFELRFPLPDNASIQHITARLKGNVLCITVPKNAQAEATVTHDIDDIDVEVTEML